MKEVLLLKDINLVKIKNVNLLIKIMNLIFKIITFLI